MNPAAATMSNPLRNAFTFQIVILAATNVTLPLLSGIGGGGRRAGKGGGGPAGMLVGWNESGKMLITPALGKCRGEFFGDIGRGGRAGARGCFGRCGTSGVKFNWRHTPRKCPPDYQNPPKYNLHSLESLTVPMHDSPVTSPIFLKFGIHQKRQHNES
uniref:Uncharacterized protein n=1 Tax=Glossina austeni TaxID=7395 RepID=A0A1A9UXK0_GLOAU